MNKLMQKLFVLLVGATGSAFGMKVSVVNKTNWDISVNYKDKKNTVMEKKLAKFEKDKKEPKVILAGIDDITDLKFIPDGLAKSFNAQTKLDEIKTNKDDKYISKDEYKIVITITHVPQKAMFSNWTVKYAVVRKKINTVYNPELILLNIGDKDIDFKYVMDGKEKRVTIPAKDKDGVISTALLTNARGITQLEALQDSFMEDLQEALQEYAQLPSAKQAKTSIEMEFAFLANSGWLFSNEDSVIFNGFKFIKTGKRVPYTSLAVTRLGKKAPKTDALPTLTIAGAHEIAIRNNTSREITVQYSLGENVEKQIIEPMKNIFLDPAAEITNLSFTVKGQATYVASLLEQAKTKLDKTKPQYIVFDVTHVGTAQNNWVVRVNINSYGKDTEGNLKISKENLTMKHGGRIKQK